MKETINRLDKFILQDKIKGISDKEIGKKYKVSFKYIEKLITRYNGVAISKLNKIKKIKTLFPKNFKEEKTTFWSFKQRGNWATHSGEYRGNWSPYVPRNVILKYSKQDDLVLDCFCGGGTTLIECKLLGRRSIGIDVNDKAIELARKNLNFEVPQSLFFSSYEPELIIGDARDLSFIEKETVDLICTHPPYANIIRYTDNELGDLSSLNPEEFLEEMKKVAKENFRVLKPNKICAILIGDTRRNKYIIPLGFMLMDVYLQTGFKLKEIVIKQQHNCKTTGFWYKNSIKHNFLLLAHEYLLVFEKPQISSLSCVKEKKHDSKDYELCVKVREINLNKKINKYETTTLWIFKREKLDLQINTNIFKRYSKDNNSILIDISKTKQKNTKKSYDNISLIFIKSSLLDEIVSIEEVNNYLKILKNILEESIKKMCSNGFVIFQAKDIRINGYLEPVAKRIMEIANKFEELKLKEIVIVVEQNNKEKLEKQLTFLEIVHHYLLIYEKKS